jgi:molybdate transport system permease protein
MVAGTMAMRTETLPIAIFMRLSSADIEGTVALILVLVAIGLAALYVARRLLRSTIHA